MKYILAVAVCCICSCTTTYITSTWKSPEAQSQPVKKVLVVGIMHPEDRDFLQKMESHMAGDLRAIGVEANSAFELYGPKAFDGMNEKQALEKISGTGFDAVLTIVMLNKEKEKHYVPARVVYTPYFTYQNRWWDYYHSMSMRIESKGYYEVSTNYFWESNLYYIGDHRLVYSIQTKSFDPLSAEALAHEYGKKIVGNIHDNGIFTIDPTKVARPM